MFQVSPRLGHLTVDGLLMTLPRIGTSDIYEQDRTEHEPAPGALGLKYDHSGKQPIILVPQPSDDPNDPLV